MAVQMTEGFAPSVDGKNSLRTVKWQDPDREVRAVVQISHGMCEYVKRYTDLAEHLAAAGIVVFGNDHLGHGESVKSADDLGFLAEKDGWKLAVRDLHAFTEKLRAEYPGKPLLLFGHSMGSFLARAYAALHPGDGADAYVFCGTGGPNPATGIGLFLINVLARVKGERYRSDFMSNMAFGAYCKKIENAVTGKEWVTSDPERFDAYVHDPLCMYNFTLSGYRDLMSVLSFVSEKEWAGKLNRDVPCLLCCGSEDPVGDYGKGVRTVYERMQAAGVKDVELQIYEGIRHEPHNDVRRQEFFADILAYTEKKLNI